MVQNMGGRDQGMTLTVGPHFRPVESVCKVVWQKSILANICQLVLYISHDQEQVEGFVEELTFAK